MSAPNTKPVILLVFANSRTAYLNTLKAERKAIEKSLDRHHNSGFIEVKSEAETTVDDIVSFLNTYHNKISIFHYAGHAEDQGLELETLGDEGQKAHAGGIAQLLGQEENLQLVFLNGCATGDQVKLLHDQGIKAVIATSVKIDDQRAGTFSETFYEALASGKTIKEAFETAKGALATKSDEAPKMAIHRGGVGSVKKKAGDFEWGLYINEGGEAAEDWKLPTVAREHDIGVSVSGDNAAGNEFLIQILQKELPKYSNKMARFLSELEDLKDEDEDEYQDLVANLPGEIIDSFPLPIGEQLRKLFTPELSKVIPERVIQIVVTYETVTSLIASIVLSQLWDECKNRGKLKLPASTLKLLKGYLGREKNNFFSFNLVSVFQETLKAFKENKITAFIDEDLPVLEKEMAAAEFEAANQFLEKLREQVNQGDIPAENLAGLCSEAEKHLAAIIKAFTFIVKYKFRTIKDIKVIRYRHTDTKFSHRQVFLTNTTKQDVRLDKEKEYDEFAESQSVILMKESSTVKGYLSLSPFIIDRNALTGDEKSRLYLQKYYDNASKSYAYQFIGNHTELIDTVKDSNEEEDFSRFNAQFEAFMNIL